MTRGSLASLAVAAACLVGAAPAWSAPEDLVPGVIIAPPAVLPAAAPASVSRALGLETAILAELNATRARAGLRRLRLSRELSAAAAYHSREMAAAGYFDHGSVEGTTFWNRIRRYYRQKRSRLWGVGENLLWATELEPESAVRSWLHSPTHRANMLSVLWRDVGLAAVDVPAAPGVFAGLDVTVLTADFGVRR